jgi:hypothetical protein
MGSGRLRAPSPAFVISLIALFVALGGTGYAAGKAILTHTDAKADTQLVKKLAPSLSVKHAKTANSATNAANADKLNHVASSGYLQNSKITISEQRGWTAQHGGGGTVEDYGNAQVLNGNSPYYLSLDSPNTVGVNNYFLDSVTICYDADAGSQITSTLINRSNTSNDDTNVLTDSTVRSTAYPNTECYSEAVHDTGAPATSAYYVQLVTTGSTMRMFRVTATFLPS